MSPYCADFLSCTAGHTEVFHVFQGLRLISWVDPGACEAERGLGRGGGSVTHSHGVVAEEAGEAAAAVLQGEGLPVGGVGGGLAGVEAVVASCRGREDAGSRLARGGCPDSQACAPILEPQTSGVATPVPALGGHASWPALAPHPSDLETLGPWDCDLPAVSPAPAGRWHLSDAGVTDSPGRPCSPGPSPGQQAGRTRAWDHVGRGQWGTLQATGMRNRTPRLWHRPGQP